MQTVNVVSVLQLLSAYHEYARTIKAFRQVFDMAFFISLIYYEIHFVRVRLGIVRVGWGQVKHCEVGVVQGCTARGPDPAPKRVLSGPRNRLKNTRNFS